MSQHAGPADPAPPGCPKGGRPARRRKPPSGRLPRRQLQTPAGTIETRGRTGRPTSTRADAKAVSRERRAHRLDKPPTWRGSLNRAVVMAGEWTQNVARLKADLEQPVNAAVEAARLPWWR